MASVSLLRYILTTGNLLILGYSSTAARKLIVDMTVQAAKANKVAWKENIVDHTERDGMNGTAPLEPEEGSSNATALVDNVKENNPQEASTPPDHPFPIESASNASEEAQDSLSSRTTRQRRRSGWKRRKQGRQVRLAAVEDAEEKKEAVELELPSEQYEAIIRRRAVRKRGEVLPKKEASTVSRRSLFEFGTPVSGSSRKQEIEVEHVDVVYDEDFGDVSLGMKLNIIGGKVIVQAVKPLDDGRASPAQLTGVIQRGDVLLSIDERSLVQMPLDVLVDGLKPLSSPQSNGAYKRVLNLRFAIGEGLLLLEKNEKLAAKNTGVEMFSLANFMPPSLPMVDQLSGQPLFAEDVNEAPKSPKSQAPVEMPQSIFENPVQAKAVEPLSIDALISLGLAARRNEELQKYLSEFFAWNDDNSNLLKSALTTIFVSEELTESYKTKSEILKDGLQVMKGAVALSYSMEDIDKGKDLRSFKAWSSTLSIRSRASTRRRFVFDASSMAGATIDEVDSDMASMGSSAADEELDGLNPDELLVQLAAHDEIWRKQVVEAIQQSTKDMEEEKEEAFPDDLAIPDLDLGSLFFGEKVNQLLTKKKKSYALPPEEVTTVLFDLVTNLASTTPDEISVKGGFNLNPLTSLVPFEKQKKNVDDGTLLATRFVIDDVFPAWLKSFKALPWEERRVLWPHTRASSTESHAGGASFALSMDDGLTLDSGSTGYPSPSARKTKKDLRETIEDMELNMESRAETCFLLTFYFTQEILPKLIGSADRETGDGEISEGLSFVERYGSYLKLPMCLAYAAFIRSEEIISKLLSLAKHDLRHREALKETTKAHALVLYEPTMLSAIMKHIQTIASESRTDVRSHLMNLCVSSYPDLRPWQVRKACLGENGAKQDPALVELYYQYLCLLLHPSEGNEMAKHDQELVKEWCELSIEPAPVAKKYAAPSSLSSRRENFYRVAKRSWPDHRLYYRDLHMLMDMSRKGNEYDLVLDLVEEVLDQHAPALSKETRTMVVGHLRAIAEQSLCLDSDQINGDRLTKVAQLFEKLAGTQNSDVVIADEFYDLLQKCSAVGGNVSKKEMTLMALLSHQVNPANVLDTFALWTPSHKSAQDVLPCLYAILIQATRLGVANEISGSLIRINHERAELEKRRRPLISVSKFIDSDEEHYFPDEDTIWRRMLKGSLLSEK